MGFPATQNWLHTQNEPRAASARLGKVLGQQVPVPRMGPGWGWQLWIVIPVPGKGSGWQWQLWAVTPVPGKGSGWRWQIWALKAFMRARQGAAGSQGTRGQSSCCHTGDRQSFIRCDNDLKLDLLAESCCIRADAVSTGRWQG